MDWTRFRQLISEYFDIEELRTLCFDLNVDYDSLRGEGKTAKVRELVALCRRTDRMPQLLETLARHRPNVPWRRLAPRSAFVDRRSAVAGFPWKRAGLGAILLLVVSLLVIIIPDLINPAETPPATVGANDTPFSPPTEEVSATPGASPTFEDAPTGELRLPWGDIDGRIVIDSDGAYWEKYEAGGEIPGLYLRSDDINAFGDYLELISDETFFLEEGGILRSGTWKLEEDELLLVFP